MSSDFSRLLFFITQSYIPSLDSSQSILFKRSCISFKLGLTILFSSLFCNALFGTFKNIVTILTSSFRILNKFSTPFTSMSFTIIFPLFIFSLISYTFVKKKYPNYLCIKFKSILLGLLFIVIFFYTYTGIIGKSFAIIDISSFFIAVFISHYYSYKNINSKCQKKLIYIT